jgi:predicted RNA binding protein with dsRBD fold (UPF0201 family)
LTKTHDLLSINQMSEQRNRSCETILKLFIKQIHTVWNMSKNKVITLLSMNVVKAYDHVSKTRLLHNFRKRRILTWIIVWTNSFMQNRRITFAINSDTTTMSNVNVDISQSSFVSFILYLFYNADFLKLLKRFFRRVAALDFVNDINILTYEFSITSNCRILKKNARSLRNVSASSRNRLRVDQIWAHSSDEKFEKIWHADNLSNMRRRKAIF